MRRSSADSYRKYGSSVGRLPTVTESIAVIYCPQMRRSSPDSFRKYKSSTVLTPSTVIEIIAVIYCQQMRRSSPDSFRKYKSSLDSWWDGRLQTTYRKYCMDRLLTAEETVVFRQLQQEEVIYWRLKRGNHKRSSGTWGSYHPRYIWNETAVISDIWYEESVILDIWNDEIAFISATIC